MTTLTFGAKSSFNTSVEELFRWHERPGAFERLTPPWEPAKVVSRTGEGIQDGATLTLSLKLGPIPQKMMVQHYGYEKNRQFCDRQVEGPFTEWTHVHSFSSVNEEAVLEDTITYGLPFGEIGERFGKHYAEEKLRRLFKYRHKILGYDLAAHKDIPPLKIAVTGASGFVGSSLVPFLLSGGHKVVRFVRSRPFQEPDEIYWSPDRGFVDVSSLEGFDAVIHLAGEPIAEGRWSREKKERIYRSRAEATQSLCDALAKMQNPPKCIICASAIGLYGSRGDQELTEESEAGDGFLAQVTKAWESACRSAVQKGIRVVMLRTGVILSPQGGALKKMLPPFLTGLGGPLGEGSQFVSWISLEDLLRVIYRAILDTSLEGPVNAVAPHPLRNKEFAQTLGKVLERPAMIPVPAGVLKFAFGEVAHEALLTSQRVFPRVLHERGFSFTFPYLEDALKFCLGSTE